MNEPQISVDLAALRAARKGPYKPYLEVRFKPLEVVIDVEDLVAAVEGLIDCVAELKFALADCEHFDEHRHYIAMQKATLALRRFGLAPTGAPLTPPLEVPA